MSETRVAAWLDPWLACSLGQVTSTLYLGQSPVFDRAL